MKNTELLDALKSRRVGVIGLGISNLPLIDLLLELGAYVTARDQKTREALGALAPRLEGKGVRLVLGEGYLDHLDEEILFRSPGLRPDLPPFLRAVENGSYLTSEMELFLSLCPATVIGITGSDGKTTSTTLTGLLLKRECEKRGRGRVFVGGNIGTPLLPLVGKMTEEDYAVVELSSFQLQEMRTAPALSAITNLSPNHLNWHTDMAEYVHAKTHIYNHPACRRLITNVENEITAELARKAALPKTYFSSIRTASEEFPLRSGDHAIYERGGTVYCFDGEKETALLESRSILLPGRHNLENYMTAIALTEGLVFSETLLEIAQSFEGVPHRLERIRVLDGVTYYNSSIDSSPTRTAAALSALSASPIVICGGYDKGIPFEPLADALCLRARAVVLTGATADKIMAALKDRPAVKDGTLPVYKETDFAKAVHLARKIAREGDTVLLSPACASFDAFKNFEERGETFRRIVNQFESKRKDAST